MKMDETRQAGTGMKLIVTIDTEEDNWGHFTSGGHTVENIEKIPELQDLFDQFQVKPTYMVDYPVVSNDRAASVLRAIYDKGSCEIATHCHPWNTPPFEEATNATNSMLCNLPGELQFKKISFLHEAIRQRFGMSPISFRSGRWGYGPEVAKHIYELGYKVDSSITPYVDWTNDHGPDFSNISPRPFKFSYEDIYRPRPDGPLVEIPVTVGYFQSNFALCNRISKILTRKPLDRLVLHKILHKLNLLNQAWLSPDVADAKTMIRLARRMMANDYELINLFFHTPALKRGLSPFVLTRDDEVKFLQRIREFLIFARDAGIRSITLSEAPGLYPDKTERIERAGSLRKVGG
jgi:hypothetical protein